MQVFIISSYVFFSIRSYFSALSNCNFQVDLYNFKKFSNKIELEESGQFELTFMQNVFPEYIPSNGVHFMSHYTVKIIFHVMKIDFTKSLRIKHGG